MKKNCNRFPGIEKYLFVIILISLSFFYHGAGWNSEARMAQIYSVVEEGTFEISRFSEQTRDIAVIDGRIYPNKSPGSSLIGIPVYFILYHLQKMAGFSPENDPWIILSDAYIIKVITNDLLAAWAGVLFFRMMILTGFVPRLAFLIALTLCLGTQVLPYSSVYMGHIQAFSFYVIGLYYLFPFMLRKELSSGDFFRGGLFLGISGMMDYFVFFLLVVWCLFVLISKTERNNKFFFLTGIAIPILILMLYHTCCFGGPFEIPMKYNLSIFQYRREDLWLNSFQPFNFIVAKELLIGPCYGLFTYNPVLWAGVAGLFCMIFMKEYRGFAVMSLIQFFVLSAVVSCFIGWWGGHSVGPRYLIPLIPVLIFGLIGFLKQGRIARLLFIFLFAWSMIVNFFTAFYSPVRKSLISFWTDIVPSVLKGDVPSLYSFPRLAKEAIPRDLFGCMTGNWAGLLGMNQQEAILLLLLLLFVIIFYGRKCLLIRE